MNVARKLLVTGLLSLTVGMAVTQAGTSARTQLLSGADLYTVSHGVITGGELLIQDGRIAALGQRVQAPADAQRIDVSGKRIYPGLISANSILGLAVVGPLETSVPGASHYFQELGVNNANLRGSAGVDPDTMAWPVARANGVLTALIVPGAGRDALFTGRSTLMRASGWTQQQMTIEPLVALHLHWPDSEQNHQLLHQIMSEARGYALEKANKRILVPDLRLEAMLPALSGEMLLMIHINGARQIREALAFAREQSLKIVLVEKEGQADAWRLAEQIAAQNVPVMLGKALLGPSRRSEAFDVRYTAAAKLAAAGVKVIIANNGDFRIMVGGVTAERNLPYEAAVYAAFGLGAEAALRAITLTPAEVLGVADRLGSLDAGKAATLFVASGDVLEASSRVERIWIDGLQIDPMSNPQAQFREQYLRKYRGLPKDVREE
ncbi:amidohydrolase family protein [Steroidobacter sp.]|uniref:amidohydrolase family protein n=1 Tax=Steroidobacter sp. TaxID=1978227 RepID=UPI001A60CD10|nr:amidohydrolase family protein [Steroidobacter sp.]MBL8267048.1 amidohydrolase family protein [Steroidobacter sp.]